ncbi:hypothetical protein WME90_12250 [Sorangium sp. So ce375]
MIKGVAKVSPVKIGYEDDLNRQRINRESLDKIRVLLTDDEGSI